MSNSKEALQLKNPPPCEENLYLPIFPVPSQGQIPSKEFLAALKTLTSTLDHFGKIFIAIKYHIQKTIEKLSKIYESNRETHSTLQKMLLEDKKSKTPDLFNTFTWLRRNLHMIQLFFEFIVHDYTTGKGSEDIVAPLNKAYARTLELHYDCMSQQLFGLLCRTTPTRSEILKNIASGTGVAEEVVINCMDKFSKRLKENVKALKSIQEEHD